MGSEKFGQNTRTLKLAKVGLATVGQHIKILKVAKVGLARVCLDKSWHDRAIPAMPILVPAELNLWLEERHADLHEALLKGNSNRELELTAKLSDGVEQMRWSR